MVTQVAFRDVQAALSEIRALRDTRTTDPRDVKEIASDDSDSEPADAAHEVPRIDSGALESAVKDIQKNVRNLQRSLEFSVDEASGRTIIRVMDKETKELIRQIPPAEVIAIARRIEEAIGLFVQAEA